MSEIIYKEIPDERPLVRFFIENGLEFSENEEIMTDLVKCWKAEAVEAGAPAGKLVGGCTLAMREGRYICDGIATDPSVRGLGVGKRLLLTMLDEVRAMDGSALYLVARAPGFFTKYGFMSISRDAAPTFFECFSCSQYGKTCHPEVMRFDFKKE